ncbi:MAG: carbon storage regulator [Candidatus Muiribacterium halophilum]|uniref:Translational regulator CsrA n=1 Tax=Muiribacterium halophilum TaxID=2053465 RepID=A0A2N5ZJ61_MUIH1|nr:MAG: carbon storage regulator [Candidatus Muirbacterium halophilum]
MLVLTRKKNQSIIIADDIEVVVVDIKGDQIKLGIKAPKSVSVHRKEVYEEIQRENEAAAKSNVKVNNLKQIEDLIKKNKKK